MSSKYKSYSATELEEHFSNYLIDSWSYSKVSSFARNEKEFEKTEIYREKSPRTAASIAGNAYHTALQYFFEELKTDGSLMELPEMERAAFNYLDGVPANSWKIQKTAPTVEECIQKASQSAVRLIRNFYQEKDVYLNDIERIIGVEFRCEEWLQINGVDIPLPCHAVVDLLVELTNGKIAVIDHKSRTKFTDDEDLTFSSGKQAITYVKSIESALDVHVDEVWFVENKESKNKDNSPQLKKFVITMDNDTRKLYEAILYEPLKRMIEAVSDPDYVYLINDNDNFTQKAELYSFWAKTMIAEVDDFEIPENKKELIRKRQKKIRDASTAAISPKAISSFRKNAASFITYDLSFMNMNNKEKIEHVLRSFGIIVNVAHEIEGYSSNTYLLEVTAGTKIGNVLKYKLDIANALNVPSVRIGNELMMYQDRAYLFIESPKKRTKTLKWDASLVKDYNIPIGISNFGETIYWNMTNHATPHLLICGATGSGKSVSIISTLRYAQEAGVNDIVIFDPKYEFCSYASDTVNVYNDIDDIEEQMRLLVEDMQNRAKTGNKKFTLVIFDEFADAVASSRKGPELDVKEEVIVGYTSKGLPKTEVKVVKQLKSLEENLKMLLQKGRSLGFRIIAATQRASVNVITGDAKVNFPVQICFRVPKAIDSKVVLDEEGAETLNGMGDGLMKSPEYLNVMRFQGFYYG